VASFNSLTGLYEIALTETSVKTAYEFYIFAASTDPAVSAFSGLARVEVTCGSEQITVPASLKTQEFSPLPPSAVGITYYPNLDDNFSSSKPTRCPVDRLDLFADEALTVSLSSSTIELVDGSSPASAKIKVVHQTFKQTVYLRASTAQESASLVSNYVALTFQVCGAETVQAVP